MSGSVFVLSGEEVTFASAEIRALLEIYSKEGDSSSVNLGQRIVISNESDVGVISRIAERAAYCRFGGNFVAKGESIEDLSKDFSESSFEPEKTFAVASETLNKTFCGELGALIKKKTNAKVSLENPDLVCQVERTDKDLILGVSNQGFKKFSWRERRPRARKFFLPSAIYPKLARLLVNLSRVKEGEHFLDPFCGTGSLLIESSLIGARPVGIDLTRWIAKGALLNLKGFSLEFDGIMRADSTSTHLPFTKIGSIATDVPYGRAASTKGKSTEAILKEFTRAAAEVLWLEKGSSARPRYLVIMHPSHVNFEFDETSLELKERHTLYVHRTLTRAISVLRTRD